MRATDKKTGWIYRFCSQLIGVIAVIFALIVFVPDIAGGGRPWSDRITSVFSQHDNSSILSIPPSRRNKDSAVPMDQIGGYGPIDQPEPQSSGRSIEEKAGQDLKNTLGALSEADRQTHAKPSPAAEIAAAPSVGEIAMATPSDDRALPSAPEPEAVVPLFEEESDDVSGNNLPGYARRDADANNSADYDKSAAAEKKRAQQDVLQASAQQFLSEIDSLENLSFQPAEGYWANTYIAGDPYMRELEARLQTLEPAQLIRQIQPNRQPFDPPQYAALGLYLNADKVSIIGPARLKVQIGLQASLRQSGQRPAMNLGVVLDWRNATGDIAAVRALLMALQQAQQPGDRFSLVIAGRTGSIRIEADQFRFGPLQLAFERLVQKTALQQPALTLADAVSAAAEQVRRHDDPGGVLGSSLVLLITADALTKDLPTLEPLTHQNAVDGIFLSIIGLGQATASRAVQRLVLLGQGSRRLLTQTGDASDLIGRELYSASRAVARALRLRISLAPGVKLIDIPGSYRLDEPQAQQVREAEQSIDRRLSRNLGIRADRGEDEEGIQIVIPHFYAGDSHVILLDVVAERAGPIAEVSARYKDLVTLGNGVIHAQLTLPDNTPQTTGPLQRNVLKNLLVFEFVETTRRVARQLNSRQLPQAIAGLTALQGLFEDMRQTIPAWSNDRELLNDEQWLGAYLNQLSSLRQNPRAWADGLRYIAFRKRIGAEEAL